MPVHPVQLFYIDDFDRIELDILYTDPFLNLFPGTSWRELTALAPGQAEDFHAGAAVITDDPVTTANPTVPPFLGGARLDATGGAFITVLNSPSGIFRMEFQAFNNPGDNIALAVIDPIDVFLYSQGVVVSNEDNLVSQRA